MINKLLAHKFATAGVVVILGLGITGATVLASGTPTPSPKAHGTPHHSATKPGAQGKEPFKVIGPRLRVAAAAYLIKLTATATDQTAKQVRDLLASGKSFNDILGSKAGGVETTALAKAKDLLDRAVTAGKITAAQEAALLAKAKPALDKLMAAHHTVKPGGVANPKGHAATASPAAHNGV